MRTRDKLVGLVIVVFLCQFSFATETNRAWLEEDVRWIITPQERAVFKLLKTDEERDRFVEQFWLRRDPTPDTIENEFKEEHYRRLADANQHFAAERPGWEMDRGHVYIVFGPPDRIERTATGGIPTEKWFYRYLEGLGADKTFSFVDACKCGRFSLQEQFPQSPDALSNSVLRTREVVVSGVRAPSTRFKGLSELVSHKVRYNVLTFAADAEFRPATHDATLTSLTVSIPRASAPFKKDGLLESRQVDVYGQVSSMSGRIVEVFENSVNAAEEAKASMALRPGSYQVFIAIQDQQDPSLFGTRQWILNVPTFEELNKQGLKPIAHAN